jgi:hypothetical protein
MAGHHRRGEMAGRRRVGRKEIECQAVLRILRPGCQRQPQLEDGVEQPVLGDFDLLPARKIFGIIEIGNGAVVAAGRAEFIGVLGADQPVAGAVLGIGAEFVAALRFGQRVPELAPFPGKSLSPF